jgi:hypothetical protein
LTKINQDLGQLVQSLVKSIMLNRSGVSVSGVPMGSDAYIKIFLADKVERFIAEETSWMKGSGRALGFGECILGFGV